MAAPKDSGDNRPAHFADSDVDFAGYDPYIVAITGNALADSSQPSEPAESVESRKAKLMTWLRENGA